MSEITVRRVARHLTRHTSWAIQLIQIAIFAVAGVLAFLLRFDLSVPPQYAPRLLVALCIWVPVKIIVFHLFKLDRGWWRYASIRDVGRLAAANLAGSALAGITLLWFAGSAFPRSLYILDFLICFGLTSGARLAVRLAFEFHRLPNLTVKKRALIYGAGDAGVTLLREMRQNPTLTYDIIGFIDDDPAKIGNFIYRAKVFGNGAALPAIVESQSIEMVLIALPSVNGAQMITILQNCQEAGVAYKTIPGLAEVIEGNALSTQIRDVAVEDLLGRAPATLELDLIAAKLHGRTVLVTGAAGSIGSELCRQIARFEPAAIVAFDNAESALFQIEQEMARSFPAIPFHPVIGSIQNTRRLAETFEHHQPAVVYHAGAYKHVPLMEAHAFEAIENNVIGTFNVALAADRYGVEDFVMISSDKAVRPTNIMGATKRLAELVIRSLQGPRPADFGLDGQENGSTKFVSVRFGNVLGSNGSVVPIFKEQIARGGPVTVTHPEMRRFFMTIPEACQLVLQSSTMGKGGEIFVLDMGDPVRIVDLARNLILLSGLRPDQDIKIEFSGVRPGEKLYEELSTYDEDTIPTHHDKIKIFAGTTIPWPLMNKYLDQLRAACNGRNLDELVLTLKDLIPEYNPSSQLLRRVLQAKSATP